MSRPEFGSGTSRRPTQAGLERWVDSIGAVTTPLLAGFSVSAVVVVSDDAANFRWPGAAILALAIAAVVLIAAVQCAYHARLYLSARSDMANAPVPDPRLRPASGTASTAETGAKSKPEVGTGPWRTSATIGRQLDDADIRAAAMAAGATGAKLGSQPPWKRVDSPIRAWNADTARSGLHGRAWTALDECAVP
jgi:hypothetical protein